MHGTTAENFEFCLTFVHARHC